MTGEGGTGARLGDASRAEPESAGAWTLGVFVLVLGALAGLATPGGGLGVAVIGALGGIVAVLSALVRRRFTAPSPLGLLGVVFVAWVAATYLWSPYERPDQVVKFVVGAPLYVGFFLLCRSLEGRARRLACAGVALAVVSAALFFAFEAASGAAITVSFRGEATDMGRVWRNLGNGLSAWVLFLPAAMAVLWPGDTRARAAALGLAALGFLAALRYGLTSNVVGLAAAGLAAFAASRAPRATVMGVGVVAAASLLFAPLLGLAARAAPSALRDAAPLSWELRVEAWAFAVERVFERPFFGWGFDASRALDAMVRVKDRDFAALPLHPHNAGLHVWLETGAVGAVLLSALILLTARAVARAPGLDRVQAIAASAVAASYVVMDQVSYGVWQEWWLAAAAAGAGFAALARAPDRVEPLRGEAGA